MKYLYLYLSTDKYKYQRMKIRVSWVGQSTTERVPSIWQNALQNLMHHWWYCKLDRNQEELSFTFKSSREPQGVLGSFGEFWGVPGIFGEFLVVLGSSRERQTQSPTIHLTLLHGLYWFNSRSVHDIDIRWWRIMSHHFVLTPPRRHFEYVWCLDQRCSTGKRRRKRKTFQI